MKQIHGFFSVPVDDPKTTGGPLTSLPEVLILAVIGCHAAGVGLEGFPNTLSLPLPETQRGVYLGQEFYSNRSCEQNFCYQRR